MSLMNLIQFIFTKKINKINKGKILDVVANVRKIIHNDCHEIIQKDLIIHACQNTIKLMSNLTFHFLHIYININYFFAKVLLIFNTHNNTRI